MPSGDPPDAAQTVVCVHGVSRNGRDFDMLAAALAERGARVIAPDLPGRGRSDWLGLAAALHRPRLHARDGDADRAARCRAGRLGRHLAGRPHRHDARRRAAARRSRRLVLNDFGARVSAAALRRIGGYLGKDWRFASIDELEGAPARDPRAVRPADRCAVAAPGRAQRRRRWRRAACASTTTRPSALRFAMPIMARRGAVAAVGRRSSARC